MMAHDYPSTQDTEAGESWIQGLPGLHSKTFSFQNIYSTNLGIDDLGVRRLTGESLE